MFLQMLVSVPSRGYMVLNGWVAGWLCNKYYAFPSPLGVIWFLMPSGIIIGTDDYLFPSPLGVIWFLILPPGSLDTQGPARQFAAHTSIYNIFLLFFDWSTPQFIPQKARLITVHPTSFCIIIHHITITSSYSVLLTSPQVFTSALPVSR